MYQVSFLNSKYDEITRYDHWRRQGGGGGEVMGDLPPSHHLHIFFPKISHFGVILTWKVKHFGDKLFDEIQYFLTLRFLTKADKNIIF